MTLGTTILIADPCDPEKVHAFCNDLLQAPPSTVVLRASKGEPYPGGRGLADESQVYNQLGQGLAALLSVTYASDGPLNYLARYELDDEDPEVEQPPHNVHCVRIYLDTTYSYRNQATGGRCDDLHAWLVQQIGTWLDDRGLRWSWSPDVLFDWFTSTDDVTALGDPDKGCLP